MVTEKKIDLALGKQFPVKVIPLIQSAKKSIDIIVYDWRWYGDGNGSKVQEFNRAIVARARAGVRVRALVNSDKIKSPLEPLGVKVKKCISSKLLHTKLMIIDEEISILGSHNYTINAFFVNNEASVIIHDRETATKFSEYFSNLYN